MWVHFFHSQNKIGRTRHVLQFDNMCVLKLGTYTAKHQSAQLIDSFIWLEYAYEPCFLNHIHIINKH